MREGEPHVPFEAATSLGLDPSHEGIESTDVEDVTILSSEGPECVAAVTYSNRDETGLENAPDDAIHVESWEVLGRDGTDVTYLCGTSPSAPPAVPQSEAEETVAVQTVTVEDDGWILGLVGDEAAFRCGRASATFEDLPATLQRLTDYDGPTDELDALTPRQREVLETAHDLGYFEVPREASAADIAVELDLDRSTVTEHLRRAERNLLSVLLSG